MINHADEFIVKKVLNGDTESFRIIVSRYTNYVYSIGMRFFRNEFDASDFVQEVFLRAFDNLSSYSGKAPFRFWLIKIAYNFGINEAKQLYRKNTACDIDPDSGVDNHAEKDYIKSETGMVLRRAVERLPENYRVCVEMYFYLDFPYIEISKITGFPVNTIKSNVLRAKMQLRDLLRGSIAEDYNEM